MVRVQEDGLVEVAYDEGGYIDVGNVVPQASVLNLQMYRAATGQEDPEAAVSEGEGEAEGEAEGGAFELVRRACRLARKRDAGESTGGPEKGANSSACSEEVRVLVAGLVAAQAACT